jgi:hypothetical protein
MLRALSVTMVIALATVHWGCDGVRRFVTDDENQYQSVPAASLCSGDDCMDIGISDSSAKLQCDISRPFPPSPSITLSGEFFTGKSQSRYLRVSTATNDKLVLENSHHDILGVIDAPGAQFDRSYAPQDRLVVSQFIDSDGTGGRFVEIYKNDELASIILKNPQWGTTYAHHMGPAIDFQFMKACEDHRGPVCGDGTQALWQQETLQVGIRDGKQLVLAPGQSGTFNEWQTIFYHSERLSDVGMETDCQGGPSIYLELVVNRLAAN